MNTETISTLHKMTAPMFDRMVAGEPTEITLYHIDRSTFAAPRKVTIVQTYMKDFWSGYYLCETDNRQRIESTDLMDREPTLMADDDGAKYWN